MKDLHARLSTIGERGIRSLVAIGRESTSATIIDDLVMRLLDPSHLDAAAGLKQAASDLLSPVVSVGNGGPLSFQRLTGLTAREQESLKDRSFLAVLADRNTSDEVLRHLITFAEILAQPAMPDATQQTGAVLYLLANTTLHARCADRPSPKLVQTMHSMIAAMSSVRGLEDRVRAESRGWSE